MIGKKINQLATELAPVSTDLTIIGDPISGVSKKITLAQLGAIFSGAVSFYTNLAGFPATGDINVIYCAKDTQKLYLWSGSAYVEVFPSQALLDTYQLRSEKGVSNGYASLDSTGKVPISQLPSSIMEYKGTWNAATNTPTLANGTGDTGDVYICNVAGTVNFGAGAITFAVGDYVIYSGSIWQRSSGAVGTVTSVAASITGNAIGITGSPVTTSGTLAFAFAGTSGQYINGAGNLTTFPTLTGFVPYTGATANVDLGTFDLTADILTAATGSYTSIGGGNTLEISHTSGSGIALNITKGGNGEGLYINKTSGTGNAATIIGTLNATTLVKSGGTSTQFLKADGSVDSSTYLTTSAAATTYLPMVLSSTANSIEINGQFFDVASAANSYTSGRLIIAPTYGAIGYQNAGVFDGLKILTNGNAEFSNSGITRFFNQVRFDSTLTNGTYTYTLPGATGTLALTSDLTGGTVTSVGLSSATSGVTIGSSPVTTSGTITLAIATASGSQQGLLSSTDWTTFNNKQNALTNPVTGTGTTNYLPKFTGTSTIGNSLVYDNGTNVGINTTSPNFFLTLEKSSSYTLGLLNSNIGTVGQYTGLTFGYTGASYQKGAIYFVSRDGAGRGNLQFALEPSNDSSNVSTSNTKMTLNYEGNLGLGVTPSAWASGLSVFQGSSSLSVGNSGNGGMNVLANAYYGSNWTYVSSAQASWYQQIDGKHAWHIAPSGTAGNAISFTQAMTLNASGNLSIGNTNDSYKLDVSGTGRFTANNAALTVTSASTTGYASLTLDADSRDYVVGVGGSAAGVTEVRNSFYVYDNTAGQVRFTIASTGAATFSSSVTATGGAYIPNGTYYYAQRSTSGANIGVLGFASGSDTLTIKGGTSGASNSINFEDTGGIIASFYNGRLGIGTTSPSGKLDIFSSSDVYTNITTSGNSTSAVLSLYNSSGVTDGAAICYNVAMRFGTVTGLNGSGFTERMRITSGGAVEMTGTIKTASPSSGSAQPWKLGSYAAGGTGTATGVIYIEVNGQIYSIPALLGTP